MAWPGSHGHYVAAGATVCLYLRAAHALLPAPYVAWPHPHSPRQWGCPGLLCRANPHAGPALPSWPASPSIHPAPLPNNKTQFQKTSKSPYWALTVPSQKFQGLHTAFCLSHPGLLNAPGWVSAPSLCPHRFFPLSPSPPQEPPPPGSHPDCSRSAVTVSVSPGPRWACPEPTLVL